MPQNRSQPLDDLAPFRASVFVPGQPIPQGSAKAFVVAGRARVTASNGKTLNPWRTAIHDAVTPLTRPGAILIPDKPVKLTIEFIMPRTKSEPKRTRPHTRRPDTDKLTRAVMDALHHTVYREDSQVIALCVTKRTAELDEQPGAHIEWRVLA